PDPASDDRVRTPRVAERARDLAHVEPEEVPVLDEVADAGEDRALELLARARGGGDLGLHARDERLEVLLEEPLEDRLLRAEQVVERADREARGGGDLDDRRLVVAPLGEQALGDGQDLGLVSVAVPQSRWLESLLPRHNDWNPV